MVFDCSRVVGRGEDHEAETLADVAGLSNRGDSPTFFADCGLQKTQFWMSSPLGHTQVSRTNRTPPSVGWHCLINPWMNPAGRQAKEDVPGSIPVTDMSYRGRKLQPC